MMPTKKKKEPEPPKVYKWCDLASPENTMTLEEYKAWRAEDS
jgi:hypothetical protein